jgi:hypothetical protein
MKLYATVSSERATKGQGGNKHLLSVMTAEIDGERQEIASMSAVVTDYGYKFQFSLPDGRKGEIKLKGKSQKGESTCEICGKKADMLTKDGKCYKCDKIVA